jgi:hypothetical protein
MFVFVADNISYSTPRRNLGGNPHPREGARRVDRDRLWHDTRGAMSDHAAIPSLVYADMSPLSSCDIAITP